MAGYYPVVTIMGPRQSGKTTLAKALFPHCAYFNLVAEELKRRFNNGEETNAYFYRNASGTIEVDLIVERDGKVHPLEIKASSTFSSSMTKGLKAFAEICPEAERGHVIYSGETMSAAVNFADTDAWCV